MKAVGCRSVGYLLLVTLAARALLEAPAKAQRAPVFSDAKPEAVGFSSERLRRLEASIQQQVDEKEITREANSENCLLLNVLTPEPKGQRPVMVYIHGGGVDGLSGALTLLSDRFVAEEDVVLVGVNHRLNVFGYTYLEGADAAYADSGNVGQLDLIAALKWVRDNIANFGGISSNVTLFGESGGGIKINALLAMPAAKGLFHRAIVERSARTPSISAPISASSPCCTPGVRT